MGIVGEYKGIWTMKYRVEVFQDNNWIRWSTHMNEYNALFNAEVIHKSRKCDTRVIFNGQVIKSYFFSKLII